VELLDFWHMRSVKASCIDKKSILQLSFSLIFFPLERKFRVFGEIFIECMKNVFLVYVWRRIQSPV